MAKSPSGSLTVKSDPSTKELTKAWSFSQKGNIGFGVLQMISDLKSILARVTPRRTGALVRSQKIVKVSDLERKIIETVEPPYGLFIRTGVPPSRINPILPVRKKALFWPGARHPVAAVHNHPGIKKNDYWKTAIDMNESNMKKEAESTVAEIEATIDI